MTPPWLSVLIPTYNGEDYLTSALNSIILQGDGSIECIAIDDGSTDATLSILNTYQKKLPIKILKQSRHGNWVLSTNYGLSSARGEYICFLHQDDLWFKNRLSIMRRLTVAFPEVVLFLHPSRYLDAKGNDLGLWRCPLPSYPEIIKSDLLIEKLLIQNFIAIPAPIFKREAAQGVGGLDQRFWYTADWDFWLKIAACGDSLYYPKPLSGFRIHPSSQTIVRSSYKKDFRDQLECVANKYFALWQVPEQLKQRVHKVAGFSIEVNIALASTIHGERPNLIKLLVTFILLGPLGWYRYIRDSCIIERVSARVKAQLRPFKKTDVE
jgi:glycosyltransferase involved in cell wall biosynthesis